MFQHPSARLALAVGTGVPARTCARIVARNGMPRLADVDRVTGEPRGRGSVTGHRSEREGPGKLIHVDVKKVARIPAGVGWRAHARGACAALLSRARDLYRGLGAKVERVMTDNGPGYRPPRLFNGWLESAGSRHVYTRPHGPWQNGKVERMNQTLAREWQYARAYTSEEGKAEALPSHIERHNRGRTHVTCGGLPPMSRIGGVDNVMALNN